MRIVSLLLLFLVSAGNAQEFSPGPYVGFGLANFDYQESIFGIDIRDDSATAAKLYGGYRFHRNWGVEASWQNTNTVEESSSGMFFGPLGSGTSTSQFEAKFDVITVRGVGFVPFSWGALFFGIGYFDGEIDTLIDTLIEINNGSTSTRSEDTALQDGLTLLGGVQWDFRSAAVRIEYEWWDVEAGSTASDDADAYALGVGVHWKF